MQSLCAVMVHAEADVALTSEPAVSEGL